MKQRSSARSREKRVQRLKSQGKAYKKQNEAKSEIKPTKKVNVWSEISPLNHTIFGALKKHYYMLPDNYLNKKDLTYEIRY